MNLPVQRGVPIYSMNNMVGCRLPYCFVASHKTVRLIECNLHAKCFWNQFSLAEAKLFQ